MVYIHTISSYHPFYNHFIRIPSITFKALGWSAAFSSIVLAWIKAMGVSDAATGMGWVLYMRLQVGVLLRPNMQ